MGLWDGQYGHGAGKGLGMQARGSLWWWKVADVATDFLVLDDHSLNRGTTTQPPSGKSV